MNAKRLAAALAVALVSLPLPAAEKAAAGRDPVLSALEAELKRSVGKLALAGVERPYFISYAVDETDHRRVEATFGAVVHSTHNRMRVLRTDVRVGGYDVDSSEFLGGRSPYGRMGGYPRMLVTEDDEMAIRHDVWLATDEAYKAAAERLAQKKAVLAGRVDKEPVPDFARVEPFVSVAERRAAPEVGEWPDRVRRLSAIFRELPAIQESTVVLTVSTTNRTFVTSEGTRVRQPACRVLLEARASTQAEDGSTLRHSVTFDETEPSRLPAEAEVAAAIRKMAGELVALRAAPVLDGYTGPVLFADEAAPALFADLLAPQLSGRRPPLTAQPPASGAPQGTELSARLGRPVLPAFLDVVDDPTLERQGGRALAGSYIADDEGVPARRVTLVEKGVLKTLLMGRRPRREIPASNGHGRGTAFAAPAPQVANLLVSASAAKSREELKQELIGQATAQGLPFALVIRALAPGWSSGGDAFDGSAGGARPRSPVGSPVLAWKVFPDGREELVRGLSFGEVSLRHLRDISAAGKDARVLSRPFSSSTPAPFSVVAPDVLVAEVELRADGGAKPKPSLLTNPYFDKAAARGGVRK